MAVLLAICTLLVILLVFSHSVLGFKSLFEYRMSKLVAVFLAICSYNFSQPVAVGPVCHRAGHGPTCKSRCLEEYPADT
jgi:hypothetical protein